MTKPYWRLLERDEVIEQGDEYWGYDFANSEWHPARDGDIGVRFIGIVPFRRRVTPAQPVNSNGAHGSLGVIAPNAESA